MIKKFFSIIKNNFRFIFKLIGFSLLFTLLLRLLLIATYVIPSNSMEPSILANDYILVNKLIPGSRFYKNLNFLKGNKADVARLWGIRKVERNDVLVFNSPFKEWDELGFNVDEYMVKRCVAIPGDTFYIENGIYKVKNCPDTLGNYFHQQSFFERDRESIKVLDFNCYPYEKPYDWNVKQLGPLYIPREGDTLRVDKHTVKLYGDLIRYETGEKVKIIGDSVYLKNELLEIYTFKKDYYFMAGDFVSASRDSRYWGLLPEDHIVGKAWLVYKSVDTQTGRMRWDRFFKLIE